MRKLVALCVALAPPIAAHANGYSVPNTNPRDLSMVASAIAAQNDAGAAFAMPAALARLDEGLSLSLSGSALQINTTWNAPAGPTPELVALQSQSPAETTSHPAPPVSLFASYTGKLHGHGVGLGVGMNIPGGGNMYWPEDWAGRARIITVDRRIYGFYATAGVEIVKQLRIGGGFVYYRATEYLKQGLEPIASASAGLSAAGGQSSWDISAELTPFEDVPLVIGVDYKHQAYMKLTGTAHFDVPTTLQGVLQDQNVTHVLPFPNIFQVGVSFRVVPSLLLTGTYSFDRYIIYSEDLFVGDKPAPGPILLPRNYTNGSVYRFGAEWTGVPRLAVRAGVLRDVSGMPKESGPNGELLSPTYSPTLPDSNSWAFGLGVGWKFARNFAVNAAGFLALMDEVTSSNNGPSPLSFPGRYDTNVWIFSLGLSYNWLPGDQPWRSY